MEQHFIINNLILPSPPVKVGLHSHYFHGSSSQTIIHGLFSDFSLWAQLHILMDLNLQFPIHPAIFRQLISFFSIVCLFTREHSEAFTCWKWTERKLWWSHLTWNKWWRQGLTTNSSGDKSKSGVVGSRPRQTGSHAGGITPVGMRL